MGLTWRNLGAFTTALAAGAVAWAGDLPPKPKGLPCKYEITILEPPPICGGGAFSPSAQGRAVNDLNQAAGNQFACGPPNTKPFFWSPEGGYLELSQVPGGSFAAVHDLNNLGWIAGAANVVGQGLRGFVHVPGAGYIVLGVLPGHHEAEALALNDRFQIVGYSSNVQVGPMHGVMWSPKGLVDVGAIIGGPNSMIADIAGDGAMTGWLANSQIFDGRAFILTGLRRDGLTVLDPIPGGFTSEGRAINSHHDLAGIGLAPDPMGILFAVWRAFTFIDGEFHMIDALRGCPHSIATGINDDRVVIGYLYSDCNRGWVWAEGQQRNLNDMIDPGPEEVEIRYPQSINNAGVIAAEAYSWGLGMNVAVLLYPIYTSAADLNDDCLVNSLDVVLLLKAWGAVRGVSPVDADLDGNGVVNAYDLAMLLGDWT